MQPDQFVAITLAGSSNDMETDTLRKAPDPCSSQGQPSAERASGFQSCRASQRNRTVRCI
jgi:hypothetical protein